MKPITVRSNWGYYDQLDGKDLEQNERLRIQFPDGHISEHRTLLDRHVSEGRDPIGISLAFINVLYFGAECQVYLRQAGILAERV